MIDTDKYEGHTNNWKWINLKEGYDYTKSSGFYLYSLQSTFGNEIIHDTSDGKLAQDAPIILEDYKRLLKNINEYVDEVEAFHKMLKEEYEMKHKIPLCPENKDNPKEHNWVMDDWVGHRCVDCGFHWCKPLRPPKWKGDDK